MDVEFYRPVADSIEEVPDSSKKTADTGGLAADTGGLMPDTLAPQEQTIIQHLNVYATITVKAVGELLVIKDSRAREILKTMTDKGLLAKLGHARSTYYVRVKV